MFAIEIVATIVVALGLWFGWVKFARTPGDGRRLGCVINAVLHLAMVALLIAGSVLLAQTTRETHAGRPVLGLVAIVTHALQLFFALLTIFTFLRAVTLFGGAVNIHYMNAFAMMLRTFRLRRFANPSDTPASNLPFLITVMTLNIAAAAEMQWHGYATLLFFELSVLTHTLVAKAIPPAVLFLSASGTNAMNDHQSLALSLNSQVVVSLVDSKRSMARDVSAVAFFNFRTEAGADWQPIVVGLAQLAPIIIVDPKDLTDSLRVEITHLQDFGLTDKMIILKENDEVVDESMAAFLEDPVCVASRSRLASVVQERLAKVGAAAHERYRTIQWPEQ
jgi:hypothetical protein